MPHPRVACGVIMYTDLDAVHPCHPRDPWFTPDRGSQSLSVGEWIRVDSGRSEESDGYSRFAASDVRRKRLNRSAQRAQRTNTSSRSVALRLVTPRPGLRLILAPPGILADPSPRTGLGAKQGRAPPACPLAVFHRAMRADELSNWPNKITRVGRFGREARRGRRALSPARQLPAVSKCTGVPSVPC